MRKAAAVILVLTVLVGDGVGDIVYLRNGKKHVGEVVRKGDKVHIKVRYGVIEVDASEILRIQPQEPTTEPAVEKDAPPLPTGPGRTVFTVQNATQPEPIIFTYMRNLSTTPAGEDSYRVRREIERWRIMGHDRKRKVAQVWIGPDDFMRRRLAFLLYLKEAEDLYRQVKRSSPRTPGEQADQRRLQQQAAAKFLQAAKSWADPTIKQFLMGIAFDLKGEHRPAEAAFRRCCERAPRVAGFHQGHGMVLLELERHLGAVAAFSEVLRLQPDSALAVQLVREAMRKTPGGYMKRPEYMTALYLVSRYDDSQPKISRRGTNWLVPGKGWEVRDPVGLPTPPYDRFVFKQAVAVPVGERMLLVDEAVIKGALEVFVRIDEGTLVRGNVRRTGGSSRRKGLTAPLALVSVDDVRFILLAADPNEELTAPQSATVYAMNVYEEMGSKVRRIEATVDPPQSGGSPGVSVALAPGESASPIVTGDGRLVGFLAGKTDAMVDGGGADELIPVSRFAALLKRARSRSRAGFRAYGARAKRTVAPREVKGDHFVVLATFGELLRK